MPPGMTTTIPVQPKFILKSMSIWGVIVMAASYVAPIVGTLTGLAGHPVDVPPGDIQTVGTSVGTAIQSVGMAIGAILGVWGRYRAGKVAQPIAVAPTNKIVSVEIPATTSSAAGKKSG